MCLSVRPFGTNHLPPNGCSWHFISGTLTKICGHIPIFEHRRYPYFDIVLGLSWSNDPESYAGGSVATGTVSHAGQVKGDGVQFGAGRETNLTP